MNIRTLNKENSIHVLILGSMLMSWSVTSYYFNSLVPNEIMDNIGNILLSPVRVSDNLFGSINHTIISGNPLRMFLVLWVAYTLPLLRFYPLLMVTNHQDSELKKWYKSRYEISK